MIVITTEPSGRRACNCTLACSTCVIEVVHPLHTHTPIVPVRKDDGCICDPLSDSFLLPDGLELDYGGWIKADTAPSLQLSFCRFGPLVLDLANGQQITDVRHVGEDLHQDLWWKPSIHLDQ